MSPTGQLRHLHAVTCSPDASSERYAAAPMTGEVGALPEVSEEISPSSCMSYCGVERKEEAPVFWRLEGGTSRSRETSRSTLAASWSNLTSWSVNSLEECEESGEPGESAICVVVVSVFTNVLRRRDEVCDVSAVRSYNYQAV